MTLKVSEPNERGVIHVMAAVELMHLVHQSYIAQYAKVSRKAVFRRQVVPAATHYINSRVGQLAAGRRPLDIQRNLTGP